MVKYYLTKLRWRTTRYKYYLVPHSTRPIGMAIITESTNDKFWSGCGGNRTLLHCLWECKLIEPLWRRVWRFLKKLKIELPYDLEVLLPGIYLEKTIIQEGACTPIFIAALFTIARTWKQPEWMFVNRGMDKEDVVHIHNGILFSYKKEWNLPCVETWMDLQTAIENEVRKRKTNTI